MNLYHHIKTLAYWYVHLQRVPVVNSREWMTGFAFVLCLSSLLRFGLGDDASGVNLQCDAFSSQNTRDPDPSGPIDASKQESRKWAETMSFEAMMNKVKTADGFLAALDQSGGSTPKALRIYGIPDSDYEPGATSMYDRVHEMRTRIITSPSFSGEKVIGAILFENTMDREIEGMPTCKFLWEKKNVVPFLKVDKGLEDEANGVQLMKPIPGLDDLLKRAKEAGVYGTKMRSVIQSANEEGIKAIVEQQFTIGKQIIAAGLVPILEPEVDINSPSKSECEDLLKARILEHLDKLEANENVMLKLSIPTKINHYKECIDHPRVIRVVALSGGYSRDEANKLLAQQTGMIASFSRALSEGLTHGMSQDEFDKILGESVNSIYEASKAG